MITDFKIRARRNSDNAFIFDSYWRTRSASEQPARKQTFRLQARSVFCLLVARGANFQVAVNATDDDQLLGWCCVEGPLVHYVYVKAPFRRLGIARELLRWPSDKAMWCSHWSLAATAISQAHPDKLQYVGLTPPRGFEVDFDAINKSDIVSTN